MIYFNTNEFSKSLEYFKRSLDIQQKFNGKDCIGSAYTYNNIGMTYYGQKDYTQALEYL